MYVVHAVAVKCSLLCNVANLPLVCCKCCCITCHLFSFCNYFVIVVSVCLLWHGCHQCHITITTSLSLSPMSHCHCHGMVVVYGV